MTLYQPRWERYLDLLPQCCYLLMSILTTTTVAMGMGDFFKNNFNMSNTKSAAFLIMLFGIINILSVRFTTNINKDYCRSGNCRTITNHCSRMEKC